jgi:predicted short-subunit dehydrogenase-like oxidoreductase (DUF2520 family)
VSEDRPVVGIIGPGRAGIGLALALAVAGYRVLLHGRRARAVPKPLALTEGAADAPPAWIVQAGVVILAVPDDVIRMLAQSIARAITASQVVLHLSGVQGQEALEPLRYTGAALGSLHPLQTIADPERAPERLRGAWAAVEGSPRALATAERLASDVGMHPFRIAASAKPLYHAGAVFASNYFVVVEAVAQRLLRQAGLSEGDAWAALRPLVEGTLENLIRKQPPGALTGPVARADDVTIRRHLASLTADDAVLYRTLGRAALDLTRLQETDQAGAARVAEALATDRSPAPRAGPRT